MADLMGSTGATGSESETEIQPCMTTCSLTLDDWIEQIRDLVHTRGPTEEEQAQIVCNVLEGNAMDWDSFLPNDQTENDEKIFGALKET